MRLAEMKHGTERRTGSHAAITKLTEAEQRYLQCLSARMTFQEMAVELGWTYHQVVEFGSHFLDGDFEQRKKQNPLSRKWLPNSKTWWYVQPSPIAISWKVIRAARH